MGYTTDFNGEVRVEPPLNKAECEFLEKFAKTRRMDRHRGPYFVEGSGAFGQDREDDIIDYNNPPPGQLPDGTISLGIPRKVLAARGRAHDGTTFVTVYDIPGASP